MTPDQAKEVLLLYRPGSRDAEDPEIAQAIALSRKDQELGAWFEQHCAFQQAMRAKLRQIEVPKHLKGAILGQSKIVQPAIAVWWRSPAVYAAAAAILILCAVAGLWLRPGSGGQFAGFQDRIVGTALRDYPMDLKTRDMRQLREFMARKGAPADYEVTRGLEKLQLTGGGLLRWRDNPVAMVCFNRGDDQMLFLFVMKRSAVKDPPPEHPQAGTTHDYATASWSQGDKVYVLAGPPESDFVRKYL
jgi:hypothetical protein